MKLSLILPYWDRQEAANRAFELLAKQYSKLDLEIIVVDDGNLIPFKIPDVTVDIKVIRMPLKTIPMCPATVWNEGVKAASGDVIVLSCIEVLHEKPILGEMLDNLVKLGKNGYVLASAWCPEENVWHCHSTIKTPRNPWGTGIAFCGMMYKSLYEKAGGFDEEYRGGAGYEDNDFINRLLVVGAKFKIRDDLVVMHPKSGASISWPSGGFERNKNLFYKKWPEYYHKNITFVCVNWGDYCGRGEDYVNKLYDGVYNNLPEGTPFRFVCFSDVERSNNRGISYRRLPENLKGWWNKLYLFKDGLFSDGERVIYLDLDTIITNSLGNIINYDGQFAILRDFMQDRLAPGVMMWRGGFGKGIWDSYELAGFPIDLALGDLSWINKYFEENSLKADIIQDLFPDSFVSYKIHAQNGIPKKASVVCFHGLPRPHEAGGWVHEVWEKGLSEFKSLVVPNTSVEIAVNNIKSACERDLPWLEIQRPNPGDAVIIGGAPSLKEKLGEIRARKQSGHFIISTNGTHDYLIENGIIPDAHIIIDARPENVKFLSKPDKSVAYYLAAQCDESLYNALNGYNLTLLHLNRMECIDIIPPTDKEINLLSGGSTVGLMGLSLAHVLGYRRFHIYGMDSSYTEGENHAYKQEINNGEKVIDVEVGGRKFQSAPWMIQQAEEFQQLASLLANDGCLITVAGEGLIPHIAKLLTQ